MMDVTVNIPEVVAEVRALFERYEQALIDKNVEVLDTTFWDSPHTIRYAFHEHGYGFAQIHAHRVARPPGPGTKEKRIRLEIRARRGCASPTLAGRSSARTSRL
jgi:AtzH-like